MSESLPLDINRVLNLEQENMHLRAMISNRDSEIMAMNNQTMTMHEEIKRLQADLKKAYDSSAIKDKIDAEAAAINEAVKECHCRRCDQERGEAKFASLDLGNGAHALMNFGSRFYMCETCGCKRCPHATDHRYACTGSNEPGQEGSIYG